MLRIAFDARNHEPEAAQPGRANGNQQGRRGQHAAVEVVETRANEIPAGQRFQRRHRRSI